MAKTPSARLFNLVKSLSGSEKRYFKLLTKKDGDSKYLRLFEAIEKQAEFDDLALKETVYGTDEVKGKKYSELKSYLYDLILRYLQQFDEQNSIDYQLKNLLLSVRSMFRRFMFNDCKYLLTKAKKQAVRYEKFSIILEILHWEKELAYARSDIDYFAKKLELIQEEEEECLAKMTQIKSYEALFYRLFLIARTNTPQSVELQEKVQRLSEDPLLQNEDTPSSFYSKVFFFRIKAILAYQRRNLKEFYERSKFIIPLMESRPFLLKEDAAHYISALSNVTISCGFMGRHDEMRMWLKQLKRVKPNTIDDEVKIHRQYYNNYFSLCIRTAAFKEGLTVLKKHLKEIKYLDHQLFQRNTFLFQYFYIFFGVGEYDKALQYLNQWLSLPRSVDQQDLQILARLLNLIVHYEMNNTILLDSLLKSTQRSLQKAKRYNAFEYLLFQALRQANQLLSKREKKEVFSQALTKLQASDLSKRERAMLRFFDFEAWLLSKTTDQSFAQAIQQKIDQTKSK